MSPPVGLGLLDLAGRSCRASLCSFWRCFEQRVAARDQLLLRLDRGRIRRGVGIALVLAAADAEHETKRRPGSPRVRIRLDCTRSAMPVLAYSRAHAALSRPPRAKPASGADLPGREGCGVRHDRGADRERPHTRPPSSAARTRSRCCRCSSCRTAGSCASRWRSAATSRSCTPSRTCSAPTRGSARRSSSGTATPSSSCCCRSRRCSATRTSSGWAGSSRRPSSARSCASSSPSGFDWLEGELAQRPYIAGERFTVADITALCAIDFGKVVEIRIDAETHPHLAAWHERVSERPSAKA